MEGPLRTVPETPPGGGAHPQGSSENTKPAEESVIDNLNRIAYRFGDVSFNPFDDSSEGPNSDSSTSIMKRYAPLGLEEPFQILHSMLHPILCEGDSSNASAILMGPRGSGKSLLLERVLQSISKSVSSSTTDNRKIKFRKVHIHGICVRGEDVASVIFEIMRQLSDIALQETSHQESVALQRKAESIQGHSNNKRGRKKRRKIPDNYLLRLRKSTFSSNLSLLETTLKIAEVDEIPIVLILDELDSFTDEGERQLLLYHLLDRVATPGSNLCFIGLTSSFSVLSLLEKRIRSRAEGTSKIVYVRPPASYPDVLKILNQKLEGCVVQDQLMKLMTPSPPNHTTNQPAVNICECMEREWRLGKDVRWFSRVVFCALSLYQYQCSSSNSVKPFDPQFLIDALETMGASISDDNSAAKTDISILKGQAVSPRIQALLDLSTPQVALLLSARRILARDAHREDIALPLTVQRMLEEYRTFRRGSTLPSIRPAVQQLLERGILVPSSDHSGGGPLQYQASKIYKSIDPITFSRLPLHFPVDIDKEFADVLKRNLLDCPTTLKEWGRKQN